LADDRNPRRRFSCISNSPAKRHPERSASQIYRVTQRLVAGQLEKKLNLIGTVNSEFKDLAQTWGSKMITLHEKKYP
jgi:hypothetical protein